MANAARPRPVETNRPVEAIVAAQLKPDGGRSRLLSRRSRASMHAAVHRHAVPRTDVRVLDQRLPLRLTKRSPRRRGLGRCRNSSNATMRTPASRVLAIPGKASALARRWLAPPSGREQKYRPDCRSGDNGEVTMAPRRPPASFQIGSVGPAAADSRILLWMQQSQGVDDVPWRVRPETDPHRPALRSPACGMSAIRGEGLPGWGNVSRRW